MEIAGIDFTRFWTSDTVIAALIGAAGTVIAGLAGVWLSKMMSRADRRKSQQTAALWMRTRKRLALDSMALRHLSDAEFWARAEDINRQLAADEQRVPQSDRGTLRQRTEYLSSKRDGAPRSRSVR